MVFWVLNEKMKPEKMKIILQQKRTGHDCAKKQIKMCIKRKNRRIPFETIRGFPWKKIFFWQESKKNRRENIQTADFWIPWPFLFYLFDKFNTSKQIHSEIYERPVNPFFFVLFLFEYKHMMIEELLKFFIGKVDAKLFKPVKLNFSTNRYTDKGKKTDKTNYYYHTYRYFLFNIKEFNFPVEKKRYYWNKKELKWIFNRRFPTPGARFNDDEVWFFLWFPESQKQTAQGAKEGVSAACN